MKAGAGGLRLWYQSPATVKGRSAPFADDGDWQNKALPLGNGHLGAVLGGAVREEWIQFNEKSLWTGGPSKKRPDYRGGNKENGFLSLQRIRRLMAKGAVEEAAKEARNLTGEGPEAGYGAYQNFGWLVINHRLPDGGTEAVSRYSRSLDLEQGIHTVTFHSGGYSFLREAFISYPDQVMAVMMTAAEGAEISAGISLKSAQGAAPFLSEGRILLNGALEDNGLNYAAGAAVLAEGGTVSAAGNTLEVRKAKAVVILLAAATDYQNSYPGYRSHEDPRDIVAARLHSKAAISYQELRSRHIKDHSSIFSGLDLKLSKEDTGAAADTLLREYRQGRESRELEMLLFQYGRYLLIASSREGALPANLQGIWNEQNDPPWSADYHLNINLQMNYWPACPANLTACFGPLLEYVDSLRAPGRITAKCYAGIAAAKEQEENGFCCHTQGTPFGFTCPGWEPEWGWFPAAAAWIVLNLWDYYRYTQDQKCLAKRIYPIMREASRFFVRYLEADQEDGLYYAVPSYSPEHGSISKGTVCEHVLIRCLLFSTARAAAILNLDHQESRGWLAVRERMRGAEIGASGQVREWFDEVLLGDQPGFQAGHRHLSHLVGLYPRMMGLESDEHLQDGIMVSLKERGGRSTGWGLAHRLCIRAAQGAGEEAFSLIRQLLREGVHENLLGSHPPFQIDANFGYTAAVCEMLLHSDEDCLKPLPALPKAWPAGSVSGLLARGGLRVALTWEQHRLKTMSIRASRTRECRILFDRPGEYRITLPGAVPARQTARGLQVSFQAAAGREYNVLCL